MTRGIPSRRLREALLTAITNQQPLPHGVDRELLQGTQRLGSISCRKCRRGIAQVEGRDDCIVASADSLRLDQSTGELHAVPVVVGAGATAASCVPCRRDIVIRSWDVSLAAAGARVEL